VLVVVEHGYVHLLAESLLDLEALGRLDVLEVYAAEGRFHRLHRLTERVDLLDIELDVEHVDVGEALEQHTLPSMTGFDADAPMSPRPRTADPFETTATRFPFAVYSNTDSGSAAMSRHGAATPGEYASERSRWVFVGFVVSIAIFPGGSRR